MEIALLAGKYVLLALIYLFVWKVYKGLIAEARADREEAAARQARAEVPRMTGPAPSVPPRRMPPSPIPAPAPVVASPPAPVPLPPPVVAAEASAESVRAALEEEPPIPCRAGATSPAAPEEEPAPEEPLLEETHMPAFLARDLPPEIAAAEGPAPSSASESVMEALADAGMEEPLAPEPPLPPEPPATPQPGPEPGTLVVSATTPRLVVLRSECVELPPGREFPLLAAATIGRAGHSLVVLPDTFVSSQHALIFLKEGRRVLRDRGSTNGTLVNGHRISGDHFLRDGDQLTVGTSVLRYVEP